MDLHKHPVLQEASSMAFKVSFFPVGTGNQAEIQG
jgi:hypothetical protein